MIEVELKYRISPELLDALKISLHQNFEWQKKVYEKDIYYNHVLYQFDKTDQLLRIRTVENNSILTYKGPLLTKETKSRKEIETPLSNSETMHQILDALEFKPALTVTKHRDYFVKGDITITLDQLEELGFFIEIEKIVPEALVEEAETEILDWAKKLNLSLQESKSYAQLISEHVKKEST